jgi:hypothetical protein
MGDSNPFDEYTLHFGLSGAAALDIGVDELANTLGSGVNATVGLNLGPVNLGPVNIDAGLDDIRIRELAPVNIDAGLDDIRIRELAPVRIEASIKELPPIKTDSKVDLGLDDIRLTELPPVQLELAVRPVRVHLPMNYSFCLELFGVRLFKFSICGEGMVVAEDYHPHATERCE